jgi:hypothetical protein
VRHRPACAHRTVCATEEQHRFDTVRSVVVCFTDPHNPEMPMFETRMRRAAALVLPFVLFTAACVGDDEAADAGPDAQPTISGDAGPQAEFFAALQDLCGNAYEGTATEAPAGDTTFNHQLVMHVRECSDDEVKIPFHVGDNRSRTWVITRTDDGLRLKHDHRHEDGSDDEVTMYGGDTTEEGTATVQEFPADTHTSDMIPEASTNIWTVEVHPGQSFVYRLNRVGTERRFRIEFDLSNPVPAPPAPWGAED